MANAKISNSSVFIPKSDVLDVDGFAGYNSSGNVQISGANLKSSILSGTITVVTGTAPISVTSGSTPVVSISQATTSSNGYLSSTDWNTFNNKTSNSGTVTEVSASISGSAYTASVSNSTTTPSISISPQGTSSQYINGAGNLITFPTLPTVNDNTITLTAGTGLSGGGNFTLNEGSDKTITFNNTITNNNQLTNGAGYITSSSLPTVGNGTLTITVDGTPTTFSANQSTNTNLSFTTGSGTSISVKDEGTQITSGVTSFNFVGAGVTATNSSNDVTVTIPGGSSGSGTVTNVSALTLGTSGTDLTSTVVNSTTTPVITLNVPSASATNRGVLTSSDWSTFNSKTDNTGTVTQIVASSPLTGGTITSSGTIGIPQANTSTSGYLTSSDWNAFNSKTSFAEPAIFSGSGTPTLATGVTGLEIRSLIGAGTSSFSGAYADLTGKPTIPTTTSQLTNDSGFITASSTNTLTNKSGNITQWTQNWDEVDILGDGSNAGKLKLYCENTSNTHYVEIEGPAHNGASSYSIKLPSAAPSNNQILQAASGGQLSWVDNDGNDNFYVTGASYASTTGTLTLTRNGGLSDVTATGFLQIGSTSTTALAGDTTTITTAQANEITANTAKVGITTAQANEITANTAKVGITTQQASDITANNAKVTFPGFGTVAGKALEGDTVIPAAANNPTITLSAGTGLSGGGSFTLDQAGAQTITFNSSGSSGGGFPSSVTAQTSASLSASVDILYTVTTSSGTPDIVVTLPTAASNSGKIIGVKYAAQNSVDDTVLIKTQLSQTIDGTNRTTNGLPLASVGTYYEVISDGTNWWIK